jgi:hypothetical protein
MQNKRGQNRNFSPCNLKKSRRGQVTIFIIIAILIVAGVVVFLWLRGDISVVSVPASIQPAYTAFISCLEEKTSLGIRVLENQAGYIDLPAFEPGNSFMPFSSQLDFFGSPVPYWYYVSGNNIQKTQVPTKTNMEQSLAAFVSNTIQECNYDNYYEQGFEIIQRNPIAIVTINDNDVSVNLKMDMTINYKNDTVLVKSHKATVNSKLGSLYNSAKAIYAKEQKELFLENYAIDNLRLYAPVDGTELTCSPKIWNADDVFSKIKDAVETNTLALHTQTPKTATEKYFYINTKTSNGARFINSKNWASSYEVNPSDGNLLIANPVGTQEGLGILGFCYISYHFVYNIKYPILIQVYNGDEIFQFPMAVILQGNKARTPTNASAESASSDLCPYKNTMQTVSTYNTNLDTIPSTISYECFGQTCLIGNSSTGTLTEKFPQCSNGYIIARADGYQETRYLYSTVSEGSVSVIMNKLYPMNVNLKLNGQSYAGQAMIYFTSASNSKFVSYPQQKTIQLTEGDYNVSVYIYRNSSINFPATTRKECTKVPLTGIGGLFGLTEEKCFDINMPQQIITNSLAGGGKQNYYFFEDDLVNFHTIEINADSFSVPTNLEELQKNYLNFNTRGLEVNLR